MCRFIQQLGFYDWSFLTSLQSKIFQFLLTNVTNIQSVIKKHFEITTGTDKMCDRISVFTKEHTYILRARGQNEESVYNKKGFLCEYPANITGQTVPLCWQNLVVARVAVMARMRSIIVWMWICQQQYDSLNVSITAAGVLFSLCHSSFYRSRQLHVAVQIRAYKVTLLGSCHISLLLQHVCVSLDILFSLLSWTRLSFMYCSSHLLLPLTFLTCGL